MDVIRSESLPINLKKKMGKLALIAGLVIILDQASKLVILEWVPLYHSLEVIPGLFNIIHVHNTGGVFGVFAGHSIFIRKVFFLVFASLAALFVLFFYMKTPETHPVLSGSLAMIFGGAVGNLIDRFRMGKVVDFLDVFIGTMHWPTFNIADSAITIGVAVLAYHILMNRIPEGK